MRGRQAPQTTPDMTKPSRIRQDTARAQMKGQPLVNQPTTRLPDVDETLVASYPAGPERAMARRAYRLMLSAGAALETLLAGTPTTDLTAPYAELPLADQLAHASAALTALRGMTDRADVAWSITVPRREWDHITPELSGSVFGWDLAKDTTSRDEAARWAELLDGGTIDDHPRLTHVAVQGHFLDVPVDLSVHLSTSERAGGAA